MAPITPAASSQTTVYSIYAGYIPQISKGQDPFKFKSKFSGKKTFTQGNRYSGQKKTLSKIDTGIHTDGKLGAARVRGSIAWYEYSTKARALDVTNALKGTGTPARELQEEISALSDKWYGSGHVPGFNKSTKDRNEDLLEEFERLMHKVDYQPAGSLSKGGEYAQPEEQRVGQGSETRKGTGQWKPSDVELRDKKRIFGANAIDVYFKDEKGNIHRLDVTAQTMDDKAAHHGLSSWEDREKAGVTGQQLLKTLGGKPPDGGKRKARKDLQNYFNEVRKSQWNPPIRAMKEIIRDQQIEGASDLLDDLEHKRTSLDELEVETDKKLQKLINAMRGGGVKGTGTAVHTSGRDKTVKETYAKSNKKTGAVKGERIGEKTGTSGGFQDAANAIRRWYLREAGKISGKPASGAESDGLTAAASKLGIGLKSHSGHPEGVGGPGAEAMNAGLEFALHMLGNVMELFRSDSARPGGYSTAYTMGEGGKGMDAAAANFVIEVLHTIHPSGKNVFEFVELRYKDVVIHEEAALTTAYQKALWYEGKQNASALAAANAIRQNQIDTIYAMGQHETGLRIGDAVALTHSEGSKTFMTPSQKALWKGGEKHVSGKKDLTHAASGKILPKKVNDSINLWLHGGKDENGNKVDGVTAGINKGPALKVWKLIQDNTREIEKVQSLAAQKKASTAAQGHVPGIYTPRENKRAVKGQRGIIPSQSLLNVDPLKGNNMADWRHGMQQSGTGKVKEAALRARMGMDGGTRDDVWKNAQKFIFGDNEGMVATGKAMVKGTRRPMKPRRHNLTFWATPYLSIMYPATQVRSNTDY